MKASQFFLGTLKETPANTDIVSHQLMLKAGLIRRLGSGLYTWLPLGFKVLKKVEQIVREEMARIGALEVLMPAVQPAELWQETHRWEQFGGQLLKITDRQKREYCFGPTHEEVITDLFRGEVQSYKQLPICFFQIQTKFRDEIRPRFGVMRAREFIMKDAYSFHASTESLKETYDKMYEAYSRIFTRLGLTFRAVLADTGAIGGSHSHEFHVLADAGEDLLASSTESQYSANVEMAEALSLGEEFKGSLEHKKITVEKTTVEEQAKALNLPKSQVIKTLLVKGSNVPAIALLLRGDHALNEIKALKVPGVQSPFELLSQEAAEKLAGCRLGFIGPLGLNIPVVLDRSVALMKNAVIGANQNDTLIQGVNMQEAFPHAEIADLRSVQDGDKSPDGKGTLKLSRGIEVGHIFMLGTKYSELMNVKVLNEDGKQMTPTMGCYGVGVSRIVAAAIEQHYDDKGIVWPASMAPFDVAIIPVSMKSEITVHAAEKLYVELKQQGLEVFFDDRDERAGVKFADCDLIGIPHRLVLGEKELEKGVIEYKARNNPDKQYIQLEQAVEFVRGV